MKRRMHNIVALIVAGMALAGGIAIWAADDAPQARDDQVPQEILAAAVRAAGGGQVSQAKAQPHVMLLYRVAVEKDGQTRTVELFANGEVLSVDRPIESASLPEAVSGALQRQVGPDAKPAQVSHREVYAILGITRLPRRQSVYEVTYAVEKGLRQMVVDTEGRLMSQKLLRDEDDDGGQEREVSLEEVPQAVRKTILREAGDHRVREVEVETRDGRTTYEAEWRTDGGEVEIKVDAEGKLLGRTVGEDDDEDGEQDEDDDD